MARKFWASALALWIGLFVLPLSAAGLECGDDVVPARGDVVVRYLANEGVLITHEDKTVLIDALFSHGYGTYTLPPANVTEAIQAAQAPFDAVDLVLITHHHGDHFNTEGWIRHLQNSRTAKIVTSSQVIDRLQASEQYDPVLDDRLVRLDPAVNGTLVSQQVSGIGVSAIWARHSRQRHYPVVNLAYVLDLGDKRLAHLGDAEPRRANFDGLDLGGRPVDLALVPYWHFMSEEGLAILSGALQARHSIGVHVPANLNALRAQAPLLESLHRLFTRSGERCVLR